MKCVGLLDSQREFGVQAMLISGFSVYWYLRFVSFKTKIFSSHPSHISCKIRFGLAFLSRRGFVNLPCRRYTR